MDQMSQPENKPYKLEFIVHDLPKIPNNGSHGSYWQVVAEKRKWEKLIVFQVGNNRPAKPLKIAKVSFTRFSSVEPDDDNLAASFKRVRDILVNIGILENDKPGNFEGGKPEYIFEKTAPKTGRIRVVVEESA